MYRVPAGKHAKNAEVGKNQKEVAHVLRKGWLSPSVNAIKIA